MNRNPIERLFGQTLLYGISSVLVRSLSYLLIPLYTSVFDPAQYGIVIEMFAYMALLNILFTFGLETSFFRFASVEGREDQVFRCTQTLLILVATVCASLLFAVSEPLARMMDYPGRGSLISMATAILLIDACVAIPFARLRLQGKPFIFAGFKLGHVTCNLLLNLFFFLLLPRVVSALPSEPIGLLRNFDPGVEYIFISNLCSSAVFLFLFIPSLRKLRIDFSLGGRILRYALPIVLVGMAGVTVDVFSRMTLKYLLPPDFYPSRTSQEILGIFGVCYKLSVMMTLFTQAFRYAYEPFFFRERTGVGAPAQNARAMHAFVVVGVIGWLLLTTFLDVVGDVLLRDESYREGLPIVPILLCNGLMLGIYYNLSVWYKVTDNNWLGVYMGLFGITVTIVSQYILIGRAGYVGSAWASVISSTSLVLLSHLLGRRFFRIPYPVKRLSAHIIFGAIASWMLVQIEGGWKIMAGLALVAIYLLFLARSDVPLIISPHAKPTKKPS